MVKLILHSGSLPPFLFLSLSPSGSFRKRGAFRDGGIRFERQSQLPLEDVKGIILDTAALCNTRNNYALCIFKKQGSITL